MDYLKWRGDLTFSQDAFNEVDNLLLSYVAYVNLEGLSVGAAAERSCASKMEGPCPDKLQFKQNKA